MLRSILFLVFTACSLTAFSQVEICNNGIDDDFDGFIDCYDGNCSASAICDGIFLGNDATCQTPPPAFPAFTMTKDFYSPDESTNHLARMVIGDLNRDGIPEMVTMNRYTKTLSILNGNDGSIQKQITVAWEPYWEVAIGNLDNDNCAEIFFIGYLDPPGPNNAGVFMFSYDCSLNLLWQTAERFPSQEDPINFGIADFDGDGKEEIYAKDEIYDAKTGVRIVKSTASNYTQINGGPVAVNITGDIKQELVIGLAIYDVNLGTRAKDVGSLSLVKTPFVPYSAVAPNYFIRNVYNATSVADYNLDGFLDVLASGSTTGHGQNTTVFFWDVKNNVLKTYNEFFNDGSSYDKGWKNGTGRLNVSDLDGDGKMNVSYVSGKYLYALKEDFTKLWRVTINEETSGYTGCTLFDFNGDGKAEIVYRDERFIYIIEGTDGSIYSQLNCSSRTNREYPIVADVDADGSTEICVTCAVTDITDANFNDFVTNNASLKYPGHIRVFKSAAEPWVPARRVWNQHGYFVVNVNDDLTIPTAIQAHQLIFSTGSCTSGPNRPLNKFLNQSPFLNSDGCPTYAAPDIAFSVAPTIVAPTCPNLNFTVSFVITNLGDVSLTGDIPITFYTTNPKKAGSVKLNTITATVNKLKKGDVFAITNATVTGVGADSLYVVLNDAGTTVPTPIVLPNTTFFECDYDNIRGLRVIPLPVTITALQVSPNETCSGANSGSARAFIPISGGGENTADYNFYWSIGAVAKPVASADFVGPIYSGIGAGTYTVYARHKTANCNSNVAQVVISTVTSLPPVVTVNALVNQTSCVPANGKLEAVITGGTAGYTIDWYDVALNPLGISGTIANNLPAGSYLVIITKGACSRSSAPAAITGPSIPDAQGQVLTNVTDCVNPNTGSVSVDALVGGVIQNPSNYTFDWYYFNTGTNTRGSILPPANGVGQTRTGLPVGSYQGVITDKITGCTATALPITVNSNTVIPTAQIVQIAPQTSCNPASPNGILQGNVLIGGVLQNPANFTFQWFKGQNTLPANLVATVSGINGQVVNNVAGGGIPYTLKVTSNLNCSATTDFTIAETLTNPIVTLTPTNNQICNPALASGTFTGSVVATVTYGGAAVVDFTNYSFAWHDGSLATDPAPSPNSTTNSLTQQDGGEYTLVVTRTDLACVSAPVTSTINNTNTLPVLTTGSTSSTNCVPASANGVARVLTVNGIAVGALANHTYQWHTGLGVGSPIAVGTNPTATSVALTNLQGGVASNFTVLVTNTTNGCQTTGTVLVGDAKAPPIVSLVTVDNGICDPSLTVPAKTFSGKITASITNQIGALTDYSFSFANGMGAGVQTSNVYDQLNGGATAYTAIATHTLTGCVSSQVSAIVANVQAIPVLTTSTTPSTNCTAGFEDGQARVLTVNGTAVGTATGFTYTWTGPVVPSFPVNVAANTANTPQLIKVQGGAGYTYNVLVTNQANGCQKNVALDVADQKAVPILTVSKTDNTICDPLLASPAVSFNGKVQVTGVTYKGIAYALPSALTYNFYNNGTGTGVATQSSASADFLNRPAGTYSATVTINDLGCTANIVSAVVNDNTVSPSIVTSIDPSTNCIPSKVNGAVYVRTIDGFTVGVDPAAITDYRYQWYDGSTVVPANLKPGKTSTTLGSTTPGSGLQGGTPASTFTVLAIRNSDGCQSNAAATITDAQVNPVIILSVNSNNTICSGTPNGSLHATVKYKGVTQPSALAPNWVVNWSTSATGEDLAALAAGNYSATVSDINTGCTSSSDAETIVDQLDLPAITTTVLDKQTSCDLPSPNGRLQGSATNGPALSTLAFSWHLGIGTGAAAFVSATGQPSGATLQTASNRTSGDYTFKARNETTGCESTQTIFLPQQLTYPTFTGAVTDVTSCVPTNGVLDVTLTSITNPSLFTIFYLDEVNFAQTGDPAVIKASAITNGTVFTNDPSKLKYHANPPPISVANPGLIPGTYTVLVRDGVTQCESNAVTFTVDDNTTKTVSASIASQATACAGLGGALDLTVAPVGLYNFSWHAGLPTNSNFNFMNNANLPTFAGPVIQTTEDLIGVGTGIYTVIVTDAAGCGKVFSDNIPFLGAPAVALTLTNSSKCDPLLSDAQIQVQVTGTAAIQYSVSLFKAGVWINGEDDGCAIAGDNDGDGLANATDPDCFIQNGTTTFTNTSALLTGLPSAVLLGDYVVRVYDTGGGCAIEEPLTLETNPRLPQVSAVLTPSTVCPGGVGDGTVQLTVNKDALDLTTPTYQLSSISPANIGGVSNQPLATNGTTAVTGTFNSQAYTLTVTDIISGCEVDKFVNIPSQPGLPTAFAVTPTNDEFCAPTTNGSALVSTLTGPTGNFTNYTFEWYNSNTLAPASLVFPIAVGNGSGTGGELLTAAKVIAVNPANWPLGVAGNGNGNKTFYARAQKQGGIGDKCYSPVAQVNIGDKHSAPQMTLIPFSNTSCSATPEGRIEITTSTTSPTPAIAGSLYTYSWTPDPVGGNATPVTGQNGAATFIVTALPVNTYSVTALNQINGCLSTNATNVLDTKFNINITNKTKADQIDCPIDGQIDVTEITIDRSITGESPLVIPTVGNLSSDFSYQWFKAPAGTPGTFNSGTPLQDGVGPSTINVVSLVDGVGAQQYPSMGIGTYYVIATRTATAGLPGAGCASQPVRVDIGDKRVFPTIAFTTVASTACNTEHDGSITVNSTTAGFGPGTLYNFDWTSNPAGTVISDATGVVSAPVFLSEALGGAAGQRVGPGAYAITVTNTVNQCATIGSVTLLQNTVPVEVTATGLPLTHCTVANGSAAVNAVSVGGVGVGLVDFSFDWAGAGGPYTGTNVSNLGSGDYLVTATKTAVTTKASGCKSAPFTVKIEDLRRFPTLTFSTQPSTSCDTNFDGQISLTATTLGFPNTTNYYFDWTSNPVGSTITDLVAQSPYNYQVGDIVGPGSYLIAVTNQTNSCVTTGTVSLSSNPLPINILTATAFDQMICFADGSATVNSLSLGVPSDYTFSWFRNVSTGTALVDGSSAAITSSLLDKNNYASMGADVYFVTATRNASLLPGSGCKTPPFLVEVKDKHVNPIIQFTSASNSSCNNLLPNGTILANAAEQNGITTNSYSFNWTLNGLALPGVTTINNTTNSSQLTNSKEGTYVVTAVNTSTTGCAVSSNLNLLLDQTKSTPNIVDIDWIDPIDCNPSVVATVTKITLGSTTNSLLFPPNVTPNNEITGPGLLNFDYEWYQGSYNAANQLPIGGPFTTTPVITSLLSGNYFVVVHDPITDCKSGPKEVLIKSDNIIYPVLEVTQTKRQVSCIAVNGTAALAAIADGQSDANLNYDFTWFNNLTNNLPAFATTSTIQNLLQGEYSVTVLDKTTSCKISAPYIIKDDSKEFTPVVSVGGQPRTLCVGIDGSILARVANLDPTYPFTYDANTFTASLFFGATPNLSGVPEIPSMPFVTGFFTSVLQGGLNAGAYTVRITDNNSGCVGVATHLVEDARRYPALEISEVAPITNCDPARPNGVARVLANGIFDGFEFDWYEGASVTGSPIYRGAEYSELKPSPQQYTIRATDLVSGCTKDIQTSFKDGTVPIPVPTIEKLSDVTSCVIPNGALSAYVGADKNTKDYILSWYDGTTENPPADLIGEIYTDLAAGKYSVTATSKITGCKSPLKTEEVKVDQKLPDFTFVIQNTTCDKNDGFASLIMLSNTPVERIEWSNDVGPFLVGPNFSDAAYGTYTVTATTFLGCSTTKDLEIKPDIRPYNGISRNNDGQNEFFMIDCIQEFPNNIVKIFNRAGTLVYEAQGYDNSSTFFDGKSNKGISPMGVDLPDGTYYYIVDKREGSKPIAGYLEIVN